MKKEHGSTGNQNAKKDQAPKTRYIGRCFVTDKKSWEVAAKAAGMSLTEWTIFNLNKIANEC